MVSAAKIQELRKLKFLGKRLFQSNFFGNYRTFIDGAGFDFLKLREYQDGDDIRFLDWKAYARTGTPLTKQTTPERDRAVILAIDASASMLFSSEEKLKKNVLQDLVYVLSWLAFYSKDKIALLLFGKDRVIWLPAAQGRSQIFSIFDKVNDHLGLLGETDLKKGIDFLLASNLRKSIIFFASDFLDDKLSDNQVAWGMLNKKHIVVPVVVTDKMEQSFDDSGFLFQSQDIETKEFLTLESSTGLSNFLHHRFVDLIAFLRRHRSEPLVVSTTDDLVLKLFSFFSLRKG